MFLTIIYGTRPEFLKLKILIEQLRLNNIDHQVIKTIQHEHLNEDINYYHIKIEIKNYSDNRLSDIGSTILNEIPKYIEKSTHILTQGDTATAFYGLLCGFQMGKKCIHLEAGMRTYDLDNPFPEEGYRQMISRITDIHLCPSKNEKKILEDEKVKGEIYVVGNTILDLVKSYGFEITFENFVIITLHRRENWNNYNNFIKQIIEITKKHPDFIFYFFVHPNPVLQEIINNTSYENSNLFFQKNVPHKDLIKILSKCKYIISDSGGIQEEANFLGKQIFLLRKVTERTLIKNVILCHNNVGFISDQISENNIKLNRGIEYGEGNSCIKIINIFKNIDGG
jgi:UDP-N-acetylglucosamine 2-epimerase (non-hydrolysing)